MKAIQEVNEKSNGGKQSIEMEVPYSVTVTIKGSADFLFHRWNCESVDAKAKAKKNSVAKKTDDIESYVWRNDDGELCIPGEYVRQSIIHAAKSRQDPRSPRKSAMEIFKAGIVCLTNIASTGKKDWDYLDTRRVTIQRNGINRTRPALKMGWEAEFTFHIIAPEYISKEFFYDVLSTAGRLNGIGDFRPTFGRFDIIKFEQKG